jgi:hypothetical protein
MGCLHVQQLLTTLFSPPEFRLLSLGDRARMRRRKRKGTVAVFHTIFFGSSAAFLTLERYSTMRLFKCQHCGHPLYFESTRCDGCGRRLGYVPGQDIMLAVEPEGGRWRSLTKPRRYYYFCANAEHHVCHWLLDSAGPEKFCLACRHNRTIPNLSVTENVTLWRKVEAAKRRLFYTLLKFRLPLTTRRRDPQGLGFDFLAGPPSASPVITGRSGGLISINLAEADDVQRERQRSRMGEPYRTLLGHFRHEIAHYYWDHLVRDSDAIADFRRIFGDERKPYSAALQNHYAKGPPADWPERYVAAYASAHPWEDFAETWAHYFHIVDTLETANGFGIRMKPKLKTNNDLTRVVDFDPYTANMDRLIEAWLPLTVAVNSINRSMGLADLYPFVLAPSVIVKLAFVYRCIHAQRRSRRPSEAPTLRAMIAGLKRRIGLPEARVHA